MRGPVLGAGLTAGLWVVAALTTGCVRSDEAGSATSNDLSGQEVTQEQVLPTVSLPDLSVLEESVRDQVRERYASLQEIENTSTRRVELANAYGALGLILMATEYHDAATASYLNAQALAPDDMRWPYYLGQLHTMTGDLAQAAEFFGRAVELQANDVAALVWFGRTRLDQGRPEAAEPLFAHAVLLQPGSAAALAGLGRAALARRDYGGATEYLGRALALDPRASSLHYPLAMAYRALGRLETAGAHLQQRGDGEPTLRDPLMQEYHDVLHGAAAFEQRGTEALNEGRWAAAAEAFRKGLALEPDNPSLRVWLASVLVPQGDIRGAVEQLEETLRRSPEFAEAHYGLGSILLLNGRHQEAVEQFSAAVTLKPNYLEARIGLAETLRVTGRPEEALPHYERAVATDPRFVETWIAGADALIRLERYQAARAWLTEARSVHGARPELTQLEAAVSAAMEARRPVGR